MTSREQLDILQRGIQKSIEENGFLSKGATKTQDVDILLDPPTVVVTYVDGSHMYFDPLYPILERDWAQAFWGNQYVGDAFKGDAAWKFYQRKMFELYQEEEMDAFYRFLEMFL